jgi:stage V sporulation protein G
MWNMMDGRNYDHVPKDGEIGVQITDVRLRRVNTDGRMKAIASITIDHEFVVHDVRLIEGNNGLFVAMPSRRSPDGEFRDIAHPITPKARQMIEDAVLAAYEQADKISASGA